MMYKLINFYRERKSLILWIIKGKKTPPPQIYKQIIIKKYQRENKIKNFIETGTYKGHTVSAVRKSFKNIFSIELDVDLFNKAKEKFKNYKNIEIIQGDSGVEIKKLLEKIKERAIFWLDGHYSAGITAKGELNTPIEKELDHILNHEVKNHIIIIDDARCFTGADDYPTIQKLEEIVKSKNKNLKLLVKDDLIIIS